jgi:5-oxoprolinase (ATP-hydrolysing)
MSVAEAMGRALQQTSISTNIKERLDYSCALFSADGDLVVSPTHVPGETPTNPCVSSDRTTLHRLIFTPQANAPFIPVHLGSMSFAIKYQLSLLGSSLKPGDVLLANSPVAGGSHLPDLTVITPVFSSSISTSETQEQDQKIIFFTASRGHHADIGGSQPGSMPSNSTLLEEEGAEIVSFKLVTDGKFDRDGLREKMVDIPGKVKGCSGCRDFRSVESDIKAVSGPPPPPSLCLSSTSFRPSYSPFPPETVSSSSILPPYDESSFTRTTSKSLPTLKESNSSVP